LTARFREIFETDLVVLPVATGTAANALALSVLTPPYCSTLCADVAHINTDECGAPEFFTAGAKLLGLPSEGGKLTIDQLDKAVRRARSEGLQTAQPVTVSLSQATEWGLVYRPAEIKSISEFAKSQDMFLHMDGARFANAQVMADCTPAQMTWKAGVDVLSFGATKNGAMAAEAVVLFDNVRSNALAAMRKRSGHLWSKSRFIGVQLLAYLEDGLWLRNARHANSMAQRIANAMITTPGVDLVQPVEANEVFVYMSDDMASMLSAKGFRFAKWTRGLQSGRPIFRFVTSYSTAQHTVDALLRALKL
jgi:threonine aldolase